MSTHPFIPLYVDDFEAATAHLSLEEDGVYNRLLRLAWRTPGCSLPNDHAWIARKIRLTSAEFQRVGLPIIGEFFTLRCGRLEQTRLTAEYETISRKQSARRIAGKMGGDAKSRKTNGSVPSNATVLPQHTRASPKPEPEPVEREDDETIVSLSPAATIAAEASLFSLDGLGDEIQEAFDAWNSLAKRLDLPVARDLTGRRRRSIRARLARGGLPEWRLALAAVEASSLCLGDTDRGWRADLDFICQPRSWTKLLEGSYATKENGYERAHHNGVSNGLFATGGAGAGNGYGGSPSMATLILERHGDDSN